MSVGGAGIEFWKGHGSGNDFVVVPDIFGRLDLDAGRVSRVCDRRRGVGGDGLIRVAPVGTVPGVPERAGARWFMDYRNADGSIAEMCGNGARVVARYLLEAGLEGGSGFSIMTRGGEREVRPLADDCIAIEMGCPASGPPGPDPLVRLGAMEWRATGWWLPNPHAVSWVGDLAAVGSLELPPEVVSDRFPDGANFEFAVDTTEEPENPEARVRVFERGVGETQSCGTGACAVALALRQRRGIVGPGRVLVSLPGGLLVVSVDEWDRVWLAGPAELVAHGELSAGLWAGE